MRLERVFILFVHSAAFIVGSQAEACSCHVRNSHRWKPRAAQEERLIRRYDGPAPTDLTNPTTTKFSFPRPTNPILEIDLKPADDGQPLWDITIGSARIKVRMAVSVQSQETWFRNDTVRVCGNSVCDFMGATPEKLDEKFSYTSPGGCRVSGSHYRWGRLSSSENTAQKSQWSLENYETGLSWSQHGFTNLEGFTEQVDGVIGIAPNSNFVRTYMKSKHALDTSSVSVYLGKTNANIAIGGYYQSQGKRFKKITIEDSNPLSFTLESLHLKGDDRSFMLKQTVIIDSDTPYIQLPRSILRVIMAHPNVQWTWNEDKSEIEFSDVSSVAGQRPSFEFDLGRVHIEMKEEHYTTASGRPAFAESKDDFTIILGKPFLYTTYMVIDPFQKLLHLSQAIPQPIKPVAQDLTSLYASYKNEGDVGNEWEEYPNQEEPHGHEPEKKNDSKKIAIIASSVSIAALVLIAIMACLCYKRRRDTVTYVDEIEGYMNHSQRYGTANPVANGVMQLPAAALSAYSVALSRAHTNSPSTSISPIPTPAPMPPSCRRPREDTLRLSQHPAFKTKGSFNNSGIGTGISLSPLVIGRRPSARSAKASSVALPRLENTVESLSSVGPSGSNINITSTSSTPHRAIPSAVSAAALLSQTGDEQDDDYVDLAGWTDDTVSMDRYTTGNSSNADYRVSASSYNSVYPLTTIRDESSY